LLTVTSKYALRILAHLADQPPKQFALGATLSRRTHVPANYLSKLLLALRNAGFVDTVRGHGGGYRLGKPARLIRLIDVVEVFEGVRSRPACLLGARTRCSDANPCSAHEAFRKVRKDYICFLEATSIAHITRNSKPPATLMTIAAAGRKEAFYQ
jgi:Rrf2 family protein